MTIVFAGAAGADCSEDPAARDLTVALRQAEPFTYLDEHGSPQGFTVDLWERIARNLWLDPENPPSAEQLRGMSATEQNALRRQYSYVVLDSIDQQETALGNCDVDVVISPLTITAERMRIHDFSQPYLSSGLALAVPSSGAIHFDQAVATIVETMSQSNVLLAIVGFLSFNLLMAFLVRRYLRRSEEAAAGLQVGTRDVLDAITRTVALRGVGDDYTTALAKLLEIFMAVVGTALSATILGVLTTAFVSSIGTQQQVDAGKLVTMRVATLRCSTAQAFLTEQYVSQRQTILEGDPLRPALEARIDWLACPEGATMEGPAEMYEATGLPGAVMLAGSWQEAVRRLASGEVDAVLGDWVALTYLSRQGVFSGRLDVLPTVYRNEPYGWGIARRNDADGLRNAIDSALISEIRGEYWRRDLEEVLGQGSISPN
nr:transporter substrate-binding domain-containing protein [Paracoccus marinaquae]